MQICWDTLENIIFTRNKTFRLKNTTFQLKQCECCNNEFLAPTLLTRFCSNSCRNKGKNNSQFNKKWTQERKSKLISSISKGIGFYAGYDTYASRISFAEEVRRAHDNENILEVKCKYCGKWFKPTKGQIKHRIDAINEIGAEHNFYCSEECKHACPIYYKHTITPGIESESSREVQPELRKMVLERDNYTCQKCGLSSNNSCVELHCHHIDPVKLNPIESADMNNCITLCKDCHLEAHQKDGCKTGQLANC